MSKQWRVLISKSRDVYLNLAWEDWLYRRENFINQNMLLLWRNDPCVVIGRYQNPWKEVNVSSAKMLGISIARRFSGGGTVYHDLGNVNFTFLTERSLYNRRKNLEFIVDLLRKDYNVPATVNKRDDIVVNNSLKISGTAAKLGRTTAYHHCTLLVSVIKDQLHAVLSAKNKGIRTNATESLPSPTVNLAEIVAGIECETLIHGYAKSFAALNESFVDNVMVKEVTPTNVEYPGLSTVADDLRSTDFVFGKTPKFNIVREYLLPNEGADALRLLFDILVDKGVVQGANIEGNLHPSVMSALRSVCAQLDGIAYDSHLMWSVFEKSMLLSPFNEPPEGRIEMDFALRCLLRTVTCQE
ncbi:lipoyltransferase 1, mitochondrial-like isoform X2 [Paramacrobiotus metropolitanus]|nr:lipoyltransferase 1, mitochondrial-like isoform X2 [Paramacrobiotus metropolitanus]XP_055328065.1 lipoyltransferase 1, mitochondrial-like isoform X2 [Paramacrobiotus metropolitanus]